MDNIILTGAAGSLGKGISSEAQKQGHNVIKTDINPSDDIVKLDITKKIDIANFFSELKISDNSGMVLINNAGLCLGKEIDKYTQLEKETVIGVNVIGTVLMTQGFIAYLLENDIQGTVINMSSITGIQGGSDVIYAKTKEAILKLTDILVGDDYPRVRAYSIAPSLVEGSSIELQLPQHISDGYEGNKSSIEGVSKAVVDVIVNSQNYINGSVIQC